MEVGYESMSAAKILIMNPVMRTARPGTALYEGRMGKWYVTVALR